MARAVQSVFHVPLEHNQNAARMDEMTNATTRIAAKSQTIAERSLVRGLRVSCNDGGKLSDCVGQKAQSQRNRVDGCCGAAAKLQCVGRIQLVNGRHAYSYPLHQHSK